MPLSDLRLLRGSIDGWREGGAWFYILLMRYLGIVWGPGYPRERERVANVHLNSKHENVKTWSVPSVCLSLPVLGDRLVLGGGSGEEFINNGNRSGQHNPLSRGASADQP